MNRYDQAPSLLAAEPARDAVLSLAGTVFDLLVKLINLLESSGLGILRVGLGALQLCLGLSDLEALMCQWHSLRELMRKGEGREQKKGAT